MKTIKIVDNLTLRQEALRLAVMQAVDTDSVNHICNIAEKFESYLRGDAILPEYEDTHKDFKEMLSKMQESFNPTPRSMWISADDEIRPAKGVPVLVMLSGKKEPMLGKYTDTGWAVPNAVSNDELISWMPIPEYRPL